MDQKTALVTGGTRRIGRWVSEALLVEGYQVMAVYREQDKAAENFQREMADAGYRLELLKADLCDPAQAKDAVQQAAIGGNGLDVVVCCPGPAATGSLVATSPDELEALWRGNVLSVHNIVAPAAVYLRQSKGRVIGFLSAGVDTQKAFKDVPAYAACKAMLASYLRSLAKELAPGGVTVNAIAPGVTALSPDGAPCYDQDALPTGQAVVQDDIAAAIWYLISPASAQVTGTVLNVGGGFGL